MVNWGPGKWTGVRKCCYVRSNGARGNYDEFLKCVPGCVCVYVFAAPGNLLFETLAAIGVSKHVLNFLYRRSLTMTWSQEKSKRCWTYLIYQDLQGCSLMYWNICMNFNDTGQWTVFHVYINMCWQMCRILQEYSTRFRCNMTCLWWLCDVYVLLIFV